MKRTIIFAFPLRAIALLALTFAILLPGSASAQLLSTPLEPGLYSAIREITASMPGRYTLTIVDSRQLVLRSAHMQIATTIEHIADDQIRISGTIAEPGFLSGVARKRIERSIAEYNVSAGVGTLAFDAAGGSISLEHSVNPQLVNGSSIARLVILMSDALAREKSELAALMAIN